MFKLDQWECPVGFGLRKGLRFSRKSLISPCSVLVPSVLPVNPLAALETLRRISVTFYKDTCSPGPSFFCSAFT